jgi:hypothetical protein
MAFTHRDSSVVYHRRTPIEIPESEIQFPRALVLTTPSKEFVVVLDSRKRNGVFVHDLANLSSSYVAHVSGPDLLGGLEPGPRRYSYSLLYGVEFARFIADVRTQQLKARHGIEKFLKDNPNVRKWFEVMETNRSIFQAYQRGY